MFAALAHQVEAFLAGNGVGGQVVGGARHLGAAQRVAATKQGHFGAQRLHGAFGDALGAGPGLRAPGHQLLGRQQVGQQLVVGGGAVGVGQVEVAAGRGRGERGHHGRGHIAPVPNQLKVILGPQGEHLAVEAVQGGGVGRRAFVVELHFRNALDADVGPLHALIQVIERVGHLGVRGQGAVARDAARTAVEGAGRALHLVGVVGVVAAQAGAVAGVAREHVVGANHGAGGAAHAAERLLVGVERVGHHVQIVFAGREAGAGRQRDGHGESGTK